MGRNNKQRRAAKRRARGSHGGERVGSHGPPTAGRPTGPSLDELVLAGAQFAYGEVADAHTLSEIVDRLVDLEGSGRAGSRLPEETIADHIGRVLVMLWESGWLPLDIVHVARRTWNHRIARLATAAIATDVATHNRLATAPDPWAAQLDALGIPDAEPPTGNGRSTAPSEHKQDTLARWRLREGASLPDTIEDGLKLLSRLHQLPRQTPLVDPPSAWGRPESRAAGAARPASAGGADPKLLATIRALLAKAESTSFPAEAEAFTAKAQDLMARHAIDAAVVAAREDRPFAGEVRARRIHIDSPYGPEKAQLLGAVGHLNQVRVVWDDGIGIATAIGFPLDLDLVELLFTSLLVQATAAMTDATRTARDGRSPSFRRAFLISYADRIAERLEQARHRADEDATVTYGAALVPIMQRRREAVTEAAERIFPHTRPMKDRQLNALGWRAGRLAADLADIGSNRGRLDA